MVGILRNVNAGSFLYACKTCALPVRKDLIGFHRNDNNSVVESKIKFPKSNNCCRSRSELQYSHQITNISVAITSTNTNAMDPAWIRLRALTWSSLG